MAADTTFEGGFEAAEPKPATRPTDAVSADIEEQARARELRISQLQERRAQQAGIRAPAQAEQLLTQARQVAELIKKARNVRTMLTLLGAAAALTIAGLIWTFIQWNTQLIWTVFALPGHQFIGLDWWMVPVVLFLDFIVVIALIALLVIAYAISNPVTAFCTFIKTTLGDHWYTTLVEIACKPFVD